MYVFGDVIEIITRSLESWTVAKRLPSPPGFRESVCGTVEIVGIHWLESRGDRLLVIYRSHGVQYVLPTFHND